MVFLVWLVGTVLGILLGLFIDLVVFVALHDELLMTIKDLMDDIKYGFAVCWKRRHG